VLADAERQKTDLNKTDLKKTDLPVPMSLQCSLPIQIVACIHSDHIYQ
jgi:hypothetical protein